MYVFAVYASGAHILLTFEPTCDITVSRRGTLTVGHVQGSVSSVSCCRRSCSACSLADLRGWSAFLKTAMCFLCFASRSSSLSHYHNPEFTGWSLWSVSNGPFLGCYHECSEKWFQVLCSSHCLTRCTYSQCMPRARTSY